MMDLKQTRDESEVSHDAIGLHISTCMVGSKHAFSNKLKMPWDRRTLGPYDRFLESSKMPLPVRCLQDRRELVEPLQSDEQVPFLESAFKKSGVRLIAKCDEKLWTDRLSDERRAGVRKWTSLIAIEPAAWDIAVQFFSQGELLFANGGLADSVRDALAQKASSTLHNRANPLFRYAKFCKDHGKRPWPIVEANVYDFLNSDKGFAPTFPRSLVISIVFAHHCLGLKGDIAQISSGRTKGLTHTWFVKKRKLVQKPPLSVSQVLRLEELVDSETRPLHDRVAAGFFLFCVFGRARYSDALHVGEVKLELSDVSEEHFGFLEAGSSRVKTGMNMELKARLLPMVVPVLSLSDNGWVEKWLQLRLDAGLVACSGKPFLPALGEGGRWASIPMSASSAAMWLRALVDGVDGPDPASLGTHSMKSTVLSWCAKYGLELSVRRALGYHMTSADRSVNIYSRDAMSYPLRQMQEVLHLIRRKQFHPDATRSGHFRGEGADRRAAQVEEDLVESSSESSIDEEDHDQGMDEKAVDVIAGVWQGHKATPWMGLSAVYFRHRTSRCIHVLRDESGNDFLCGRRIGQQFIRLDKKPEFMHPVCAGCERSLRV